MCRGCSTHSAGNGSNTRASVTSGPCITIQSIASTISGASSVSRITRVM